MIAVIQAVKVTQMTIHGAAKLSRIVTELL